MYAHWLDQEFKANALPLHKIVLMWVSSHLIFGAPINHRHVLSPQSLGDRCAIDCGISSANHHHVPANPQVRRAHLALLDIFQSVNDALLSRNAKARCCSQPNAQEYRVKPRLQVCELEIPTHFLSHFQFHAHPLNHGNFAQSHFYRFAKSNDSVGGKSTREVATLKYAYAMPALSKFTGTGKPSGARANHRDS